MLVGEVVWREGRYARSQSCGVDEEENRRHWETATASAGVRTM